MPYDKMRDFAETIYHVFKMVNDKADRQRDQKMKYIGALIFKYLKLFITKKEMLQTFLYSLTGIIFRFVSSD